MNIYDGISGKLSCQIACDFENILHIKLKKLKFVNFACRKKTIKKVSNDIKKIDHLLICESYIITIQDKWWKTHPAKTDIDSFHKMSLELSKKMKKKLLCGLFVSKIKFRKKNLKDLADYNNELPYGVFDSVYLYKKKEYDINEKTDEIIQCKMEELSNLVVNFITKKYEEKINHTQKFLKKNNQVVLSNKKGFVTNNKTTNKSEPLVKIYEMQPSISMILDTIEAQT